MIGIYKFTNKITGESYIGQSTNIGKRYLKHKNAHSKWENSYFHRAIREYGFDNFEFEILEECSKSDLDERENFYIKQYGTLFPNGYNKNMGGSTHNTIGFKTYEDINEVFELLKNSDLTNIEIGKMFGVSDQTICDINSGRTWRKDNVEYPIRNGNLNKRLEYHCILCNKILCSDSKSGMCRECYSRYNREKNLPSKEDLYNLLFSESFSDVGK